MWHAEDVEDPARADQGPGGSFDRHRRGAQRDDEEERIAVERDQIAGVDPAREDEPGSQPGQEDNEDPRQEHLGGVESRLEPGHPDARMAHVPGLFPIPAEEHSLATDATQNPQAGDKCRRRVRSAAPRRRAARADESVAVGGSARGR